MKTVLLTGATGFVGSYVLKLAPAATRLEAFVRDPGKARLPAGVGIRAGNLDEPETLRRALEGVDVLLNVASLGFGHAPGIVRACREARVPRAVFVSTTAIFTKLPAKTKPLREQAELLIRESGLAYTILRPTMIYGDPGDRNIWRLIRFLRRSPVAPLVGGGKRLQQPIHVEDVARAVWQVLEHPATVGKAYDIAGARALSFAEMVRAIARRLNRRVAVVPVPLRLALAGAAVARAVPLLPHISAEQLLRLEEDKAFDIAPAREAFGFDPMDFEAGVAREIAGQ